MPDQAPSFEHALEMDMQQLALEIKKNREQPELKNAGEREIVKEAIRAFPPLNNLAPATPATSAAAAQANSPLPAYAQNAPAEVRLEIEFLLDLAFREGIGKAAAEAQKSPYFVQDAFHDALAGKLYPELQRRGIVQ